jgi:hypothetical protein
MKEKDKPTVTWLFYHVEEYSHLNLDLKQLEKWEKLIQDIISRNSIPK